VQQASRCGFESLTIGTLAEKMGLSKSGSSRISIEEDLARRLDEARACSPTRCSGRR
jgi:hypothetical protein